MPRNSDRTNIRTLFGDPRDLEPQEHHRTNDTTQGPPKMDGNGDWSDLEVPESRTDSAKFYRSPIRPGLLT